MAKAEGKVIKFLPESKINTNVLETFPARGSNQMIETITHEFSAVCPFSGLPDVATVIIRYVPEKDVCVELKSLKYYFVSFRPVGIYQEHATQRIWEDLMKILGRALAVRTIYKTRGGFDTICTEGELSLFREP